MDPPSWTIKVTTTGVSGGPAHHKLNEIWQAVTGTSRCRCLSFWTKIMRWWLNFFFSLSDSSPSSLQAMDADLGSNLTYRIRTEGSDQEIFQLFHINPVTGELSVQKGLDYEALTKSEAMYTFTVEALDTEGVMPPGLASVTVRIMVSCFCRRLQNIVVNFLFTVRWS